MSNEYNIADLTEALDSIAASVRANDEDAYLAAVAEAKKRGCTEEQIRDAYNYPAKKTGFPSFKHAS